MKKSATSLPNLATLHHAADCRSMKTIQPKSPVSPNFNPTSADEVEQIVLLGNTRQTQSPTNANETSSRSRAVLQIHATRWPPLRAGNCINSLCESGGAIRHAPYRNSKLTRLLKFSLGGNCKTVMIVCVAPTLQYFDDTHNTLIYAERATRVKTKVVTRNVLNVNRHVGQYIEAINRLNQEVA